MDGISTTQKPLITPTRWRAMCRALGVLATLRRADDTYAVTDIPVIPDNVDTRLQLDTGIAAGTPIAEALLQDVAHPDTHENAFKNGDTLTHSGHTWRINGAPLVDHIAGIVTYTLNRMPQQ